MYIDQKKTPNHSFYFSAFGILNIAILEFVMAIPYKISRAASGLHTRINDLTAEVHKINRSVGKSQQKVNDHETLDDQRFQKTRMNG